MPACIICKTLEGDVKKALEDMNDSKNILDSLKRSDSVQVLQIGMRKYENLKKASKDAVVKEIEKRHVTHILNYKTLTIHRKGCSRAGKNILNGYIVNDTVTGLRRCKHCLS